MSVFVVCYVVYVCVMACLDCDVFKVTALSEAVCL